MSHSAHNDPDQMKERFDPPEVLREKIQRLANLIQESNHLVAFTGAGISTSAGIPDFRGPKGKWTREAQGLKPISGVSTVKAYPTKTHMALVQLARSGQLKYLISQNCDGLHVRSGFPRSQLSELHGNGKMEVCETCGQKYHRDHKIGKSKKAKWRDRFTGRFCVREDCRGRLLKSTICFGQNLPTEPLEMAEYHSMKADLHVALGSSLTVTPAADCPESTAAKDDGNLIIINLQKTPLTRKALFQIYGKTDEVMTEVMKILGQDIPEFRLLRKVIVGCDPNLGKFYLRGADHEDPTLEVDFIRDALWNDVVITDSVNNNNEKSQVLQSEVPSNKFDGKMRQLDNKDLRSSCAILEVELQFIGHYSEPSLTLANDFTQAYKSNKRVEYLWSLEYNPYTREWRAESELSAVGRSEHVKDPSFGELCTRFVMDGLMKKMRGRNREEKARAQWEKHVDWTKKL